MDEKTYMKIGELEKRSGLPRSTIHFYVREGILQAPVRTGKTMAYYDDSHLERLALIKEMKAEFRMPVAFLKKKIAELESKGLGAGTLTEEPAPEPSPSTGPQSKRRQEFIDAAIKVFIAKGYRRTSVRDITEEVGVSTGTFYIYFPNKRELFLGVVDDVFKGIVGQAEVAIRGAEDLVDRATIRARVFYDNYARYSEILNQLRAEMAGEEQWPQQRIKKIYKDLTEPPIREARDAVESGLIKKGTDPELLVWAMTGIIEIMSLRMAIDDKYTFEEITEFMFDLAMNGVAPRDNHSGDE